MTSVWTLEFSAPADWLNSNSDRRMYFMVKARIVKRWREATYFAARSAKLPKDLQRVRIDVLCLFPRNANRDAGNWYPTAKACVDGLGPERRRRDGSVSVGYGLVPDDNTKHLDGPHVGIGILPKVDGKPAPCGRVRITITDLSSTVRVQPVPQPRVEAEALMIPGLGDARQ